MTRERKYRPQKKSSKQAEELIDILLYKDNIPDEILAGIQRYLLNEGNQPAIGGALRKEFIKMYKREENPKYAYEMWPKMARRLGMDVNLIRMPGEEPSFVLRPAGHNMRKGILLRVAAALIPVLIVTATFFLVNISGNRTEGGAAKIAMVSVAADTARTVELPDGSTVDIKPGSTLAYAKDFAKNRSVTLDGEAWFSVTKNAGNPFSVSGGQFTVTVLGTEFNVATSDREGNGEVTLASGSVSVTADGVAGATVMSPGQQLVYDRHLRTVDVYEVDEAELMRLQGAGLAFDNTLDEIFRICERHYGVTIVRDAAALSGLRHSVRFDPDSPIEYVMNVLQALTGEFQYTIQNDTVKITTYEAR